MLYIPSVVGYASAVSQDWEVDLLDLLNNLAYAGSLAAARATITAKPIITAA